MFDGTKVKWGLLAALSVAAVEATAQSRPKVLTVQVSGLTSKEGSLLVKLYRRGDDVPRGKGFREARVLATNTTVSVQFTDLNDPEYALFVFHDINDNQTLDHNFLGIPTEPMGFSNGFKVTLLTGIPDFDDLAFRLTQPAVTQGIVLD